MYNRLFQRLIAFPVLIFSYIALTGCSEAPQSPLRLASSPWPGYEPLYLARDLGYLDEKKVSLFELPSSDITMESFRNHSADVATLTLDETLELIHDGTELKILLVLDVSHGGDAVLARPEIKQLSDIKGKRISIVNIPLGLYMLNRLLDKAGIERSDVKVFPMAETKQEKFYRDGKADLVITFEPVKTKIVRAGAHVIFDSSMIPNEIFDILVVHDDVYNNRKPELCELASVWFKTRNYMDTNKDDAAKRITHRLGLKITDYDSLLDGIILPDVKTNKELLGGEDPGLLQPSRRLSDIMFKEKQLLRKIDASIAIDSDFTSCYK